MTATDELRRMLDERGVEWREFVNVANCVFTTYESPIFGEITAIDNEDGTLYYHELNGIQVTPEQAIAVTFGPRTCHNEAAPNCRDYWFCCSDCEFVAHTNKTVINFCPNCGRRVVEVDE